MSNIRTLPIETGVVSFTIKIGGIQIERTYGVMSIVVNHEVNKIPSAKILLLDGSAASQDFPASNEDKFIPGKKIEILAGYNSDETSLFKGLIIKHSLKIRGNAAPMLELECKDELVKLTIDKNNHYYYDKKDSEAIEDILDRGRFDHDLEDTEVLHKEIVQFDATDWDFIVSRADVNGKLCFCEEGKLVVKKPDFRQKSSLTLQFGATVLEFDAEMDARYQYQSVESSGWDYANQQVTSATAEDPGITEEGNLSSSDLAAVFSIRKSLQHGGAVVESELQKWADAHLLKSKLARIRGRVKFQGFPKVKCGDIVKLDGVGDRFNGEVFISGIRHEIMNGGWITNLQFGLSHDWFSQQYEITHQPASGMLPAVHGLQIGIVTKLESDPDNEHRVRVRLPIISAEEDGVWARVNTLDAGDNRGTFFRPEINDEVIVGFLNDDPRYPVVLGMLNSSAKPAPLTASDANNEKGYVSREGIKFIFDDEKKSVTIETPAGKKIIMDEDAGEIHVEDENGNKLVMDSSGISMESQQAISIKSTGGDVTIEGTNVSLKSNASLSLEGTAGAEIKSSGTTKVTGALVQIN